MPAESAALDSGFIVAMILAVGVVALIVVAMTAVALHRSARLTATRGGLSIGASLAVTCATVSAMLAVSSVALT